MRKRWMSKSAVLRVWAAGGTALLLGGCGLSDQQLTAIATSTISTGLNTLVSQALIALFSGLTQVPA